MDQLELVSSSKAVITATGTGDLVLQSLITSPLFLQSLLSASSYFAVSLLSLGC